MKRKSLQAPIALGSSRLKIAHVQKLSDPLEQNRFMAYLVESGGRTLGPFSLDELPDRVQAREFALTDLACDEYHGRWMPVDELLTHGPAEIKTIPNTLDQSRTILSAVGWTGLLAILYFFYRVGRLMHTWVRLHPH